MKNIPEGSSNELKQLVRTISEAAQQMPPMLKHVALSAINGLPTIYENVMLLVNPQDGQVSFWNINELWDRTWNDFRTLEMDTNRLRREMIELDSEIQKRRELLANYQARMPKVRGGFEVN